MKFEIGLLDRGVTKVKSNWIVFRRSKFAQDAALLLLFNFFSRGISFLGSAYAARTLGPTNIGISGLIQATTQQVSLTYNGGFDTVAIRKIAADKGMCQSITATITFVRLCFSFVASIIWTIVCYLWIAETQRTAWLLGVPILLSSAAGITFAFQGLEKLPIQNAIGAGGSLLCAIAYFLFFSPGMSLGADLIVISSVGVVTTVFSWSAYFRIFGSWPFAKLNWVQLFKLLTASWRYWLLSIVVYFYSIFQIPLVAYFLGPKETGIFRSAFMMAAGVELLFNSINSLLLARLVNWTKMGLQAMWRKQTRLLLIFLCIALPVVVLLLISAPLIYKILLGRAFLEGVRVFQILVVGRMVVFLGQIYAWGLVAAGKDTTILFSTIFGAIINVTLNLLFIPLFGIVGVACVSVISETVVHVYCYFGLKAKLTEKIKN